MVLIFFLLLGAGVLRAQSGDNVLLVVNKNDSVSRQIGDYYRPRRSVPLKNVCYLSTTTDEEIEWRTYSELVEAPIAAEFVSTSARTFKRPADTWKHTTWEDRAHYYAGTPQGLIGDVIHEGATGASGNTYEPYLSACVRPDYLLPAYHQGRNLAESYYIALPFVSWQGVVVGDPLCALK